MRMKIKKKLNFCEISTPDIMIVSSGNSGKFLIFFLLIIFVLYCDLSSTEGFLFLFLFFEYMQFRKNGNLLH